MIFKWNFALTVDFDGSVAVGGSSSKFLATVTGLDIWVIIQFLDYGKSASVSQLAKGKSRNLQKLLKYFNGATTFVSNILLSACVLRIVCVFLPIIFVTQKIYLLLICCYLPCNYQQHYFHSHHHSIYLYDNSTNYLMS